MIYIKSVTDATQADACSACAIFHW